MSEGPAGQAVAFHAHVGPLPPDVLGAERGGLCAAGRAQGPSGARCRQVRNCRYSYTPVHGLASALHLGLIIRRPSPRPRARRPHSAVDYSDGLGTLWGSPWGWCSPRTAPTQAAGTPFGSPTPTPPPFASPSTPAASGTHSPLTANLKTVQQVLQRQSVRAQRSAQFRHARPLH